MKVTRNVLADLADIELKIGYNCRATLITEEQPVRIRAQVNMYSKKMGGSIKIALEEVVGERVSREALDIFAERARKTFCKVIGPDSY